MLCVGGMEIFGLDDGLLGAATFTGVDEDGGGATLGVDADILRWSLLAMTCTVAPDAVCAGSFGTLLGTAGNARAPFGGDMGDGAKRPCDTEVERAGGAIIEGAAPFGISDGGAGACRRPLEAN